MRKYMARFRLPHRGSFTNGVKSGPNLMLMLCLVKVSDWNSFRTNQVYCHLFRNLNQSEKSFQSRLMQIGWKSILINPSQFESLNPNKSRPIFQSWLIRIRNYSDWESSLKHCDLGFRTSFGFIWIGRLRVKSIEFRFEIKILDWVGLIFNLFGWNEIENFFRIDSD